MVDKRVVKSFPTKTLKKLDEKENKTYKLVSFFMRASSVGRPPAIDVRAILLLKR